MKQDILNRICIVLSVLTMLAGLGGMLFCLEDLWKAEPGEIVMAGLPFIGGAILLGCGLISLAISVKEK